MTRGWSEKETSAVTDGARIAVFAHLAAKFRYIGSGAVCGSRVFDLVQCLAFGCRCRNNASGGKVTEIVTRIAQRNPTHDHFLSTGYMKLASSVQKCISCRPFLLHKIGRNRRS